MPTDEFMHLVETNDHEGETWHFWLPIENNKAELHKLIRLMDAEDIDAEQYFFASDIEPESAVDFLVLYADEGYMATHQKLTGRFICPKTLGEHGDVLYKGGLRNLFTKET